MRSQRTAASQPQMRRPRGGADPFAKGSAFDETPVRPMKHYDTSSWWAKLEMPSSEGFSTEDSLKYLLHVLEEIHLTACELHERRIADNAVKKGRPYLTPSFHGRTPTAAAVLGVYLTTRRNDDEERRSFESQWHRAYK